MRLIDTEAGLTAAGAELAHGQTFFIDTEFESNRDGKILSLLQVSAGEEIYLVDALRLKRLTALGPVLTRPDALWVLHAGREDVELLKLALQAPPPQLFDVQIAWAFLGPEYGVSLAYLQYKLLGLRPEKAHQTDDWLARPLSRALLEYAAADIEHLPEIARQLRARTDRLGRTTAVIEASHEFLLPDSEAPAATELTLDSFRNAWQLEAAGQAVLLDLIAWYNGLPPKDAALLQPKTLLAVAGRRPQTIGELRRLKGVSPRLTERYGNEIVARIQASTALGPQTPTTVLEPPAYATFEDIRLDAWLDFVRAEICARLGIAPEVALPTKWLRRVRAAIRRTGSPERGVAALEGWRRELLTQPYLDLGAVLEPPIGSSSR